MILLVSNAGGCHLALPLQSRDVLSYGLGTELCLFYATLICLFTASTPPKVEFAHAPKRYLLHDPRSDL
jgi:hypothetical protein